MKRMCLVAMVAACGGGGGGAPDGASADAPVSVDPTDNPARAVTATSLAVDVSTRAATAQITFAPSDTDGATLETGDLVIADAKDEAGRAIRVANVAGKMTLGLPRDPSPRTVTISYSYLLHESFDGVSKKGFTFTWPYFCGNMFPCHSNPVDGTTFALQLANVPDGKTAVYPTAIPAAAPAYQLAWSIDTYSELPLGTTAAGTNVSLFYRNATEMAQAQTVGAHLVAAWDWLETNIGPYQFGDHVGGVSVAWPAGAYGGMEHHPFWHVASTDFADENTQVHESSHGWFGDGIRLACWEDFVLSEGTVSYLAGHVLDIVDPPAGAQTWTDYANELAGVAGTDPVWPDSCGAIDVLNDNLYTNAPYMRGAMFYRAVALTIGADPLDAALHAFYMAHMGQPATMAEMLTTIHDVTGFDPTTCAQAWLRSTTIPEPNQPCPTSP